MMHELISSTLDKLIGLTANSTSSVDEGSIIQCFFIIGFIGTGIVLTMAIRDIIKIIRRK